MKNKSIVSNRAILFAGVSLAALGAASSAVSAAEPTFNNRWTWWVEGGAINTGGGSTFVGSPGPFGGGVPGPFGIGIPTPPFTDHVGIKPKGGAEGAIGFDYMPIGSMYHYSGQLRYGAAKKSKNFSQTRLYSLLSTGGSTSTNYGVANTNGSATIKEQHWLVDFAVGRDFALGSGVTQVKFGVRVADLTSKTNASASILGCERTTVFVPGCGGASDVNGSFSFQSRSRFLGAGPRLGIDGSMPIAGSFAFDFLGGVAALFGERSLKATINQTLQDPDDPRQFFTTTANINSSPFATVFNLDAQAGISYWFTPAFKLAASYRFDGYWNAIRTLNANGAVVNENRFYSGPMLRAAATF
jgi:hypothetical protein